MSREIKLAAMFVIAIFFLWWGMAFLGGKNYFSRKPVYYAKYSHIDGLMVSNSITINGYVVGQVRDVGFVKPGSTEILVKFDVKKGVLIPDNTVAEIYSNDLMGTKSIALIMGDSKNYAEKYDTLLTRVEVGILASLNEQFRPIKMKTESLLQGVDSMVSVVQSVFNSSLREKMTNSISSLEKTMGSFERTILNVDTLVSSEKERVVSILHDVQYFFESLKKLEGRMSILFNNIEITGEKLAAIDITPTIEHTNSTLDKLFNLLNEIENGGGTTSQLIKSDSLYLQVLQLSQEMSLLMEDMRINPKKYVHFSIFGRKK